MKNISSEAKLNFAFYCSVISIGAILGLICLFISITFSSPFFLILAVCSFVGGITGAIVFYFGEKKSDFFKQTHYMKEVADRWHERKQKKPKQHPKTYHPKSKDFVKEKIPPVEIIEDDKVVEEINRISEELEE